MKKVPKSERAIPLHDVDHQENVTIQAREHPAVFARWWQTREGVVDLKDALALLDGTTQAERESVLNALTVVIEQYGEYEKGWNPPS